MARPLRAGNARRRLSCGARRAARGACAAQGYHRDIDSYSAFYENDRATPTGLAGYLRERGLKRVFCAGLALDYCVRYSAEDAAKAGFEAFVIEDACRAIDTGGSLEAAYRGFAEAGVRVIAAQEISAAA